MVSVSHQEGNTSSNLEQSSVRISRTLLQLPGGFEKLEIDKYGEEFKEKVFPAENLPMCSMHGKCPDCCLQPSYCRDKQNMSSRILVWTENF